MRKTDPWGLSHLFKVLQLSVTALVWILPEAEPETRVLGKVVYWEVIPGNTAGEGEGTLERKESQLRMCHQASDSCGQLELSPARTLWETA